MRKPHTPAAPIIALTAALAAAGALSGCMGMIDENATLDPAVMESPGVDSAREANYPRGSAQPNPRAYEYDPNRD